MTRMSLRTMIVLRRLLLWDAFMRALQLSEAGQELLENFLESLTPEEMAEVQNFRGFDGELSARFWRHMGRADTPPGEIKIEADLAGIEAAFGNITESV
jgi:hypothetical protein